MENATIALVLAGGRGARMGILCQTRPKPLLPHAGVHRVIGFTLANCVNSGIVDLAAPVERCVVAPHVRPDSFWSQGIPPGSCIMSRV